MCSQYWNLRVECPVPCGGVARGLQSHFLGEVGSCEHRYAIGEPVEELGGYSGEIDDLIGECDEHKTPSGVGHFFDFTARVVDGRIVGVWLREPANAG